MKRRGLPSSEQPHQLVQCLPSPPYPNLETTEKSEWHYEDDNHMFNTGPINHCARKIESYSSQLFMTQKEFQGVFSGKAGEIFGCAMYSLVNHSSSFS